MVPDKDEDRLKRLETDMYFGSERGLSVTVRLQKVEVAQVEMDKNINDVKGKIDKMQWYAIITLVGIVIEIALHAFKH